MSQGTLSNYTIQEVADQLGLSLHTLRYYERIGLVDPIHRAENGHRRYTEADISRLQFIQKMRATGMPIVQLQKYIILYDQGESSRQRRLEMLCQHRATVQAQVDELLELLSFIDYKISMHQPKEENNG